MNEAQNEVKEKSEKRKKDLTRRLTESAIMIALATVLSLVKLADLPYGGSITLVSMLPVLLLAYRHGVPWGLLSGAVFGVIQQLLGLKNLSYFTSPWSIIAIILLDYLIAFAVIGLGGAFRKIKNQSAALCLGGLLAGVSRYLCHVLSGATVWAGVSIPTKAALVYSLIYNATYMIPETIVLCLTAVYLGQALDFSESVPKRRQTVVSGVGSALRTAAAGLVVAALVFDVVKVFSVLQNGESGEFDFAALAAQSFYFFLPMIVVSVLALAVAVFLFVFARKEDKKLRAQLSGSENS